MSRAPWSLASPDDGLEPVEPTPFPETPSPFAFELSTENPAAPSIAVSPAFLAELSHELRASVLTMIGYTEMLSSSERDARGDGERLQGIRAHGEHLLQLLSSMLDISQLQSGAPKAQLAPCPIAGVTQEVIASYLPQARVKGLELVAEIAPDLPRQLRTDGARVRRILLNLVSNAVKYSERGRITVRVEMESRSKAGKPLDPLLRFEVHDQGVGISADEVQQLARPFYRGRFAREHRIDGTGLGLAITRQLVEQLGGQLAVASEAGHGTTFRVRLPLEATDPPLVDRTSAAAESCAPLAGRVLLVDDNPEHRLIIGGRCRQAGLVVDLAASGYAALALPLGQYGLIVLDQRMPRLDGVATARAMRALGYQGPLLSLTAGPCSSNAPLSDRVFTHQLGKEADPGELVALLREILSPALDAPRRGSDHASGADGDAWSQLVASYVVGLPEQTRDLQRALAADDPNRLRALAHRLAGSAGLYGFPQLTDAARRLEHALAQQAPRATIFALGGTLVRLLQQSTAVAAQRD